MIDPHVHFRDWNQSAKETVLHGLITGAKAGFDVFFDMPNSNPSLTDRETTLKRLEMGAEAQRKVKDMGYDTHYHVYCGVTCDRKQIEEVVDTYNSLFPKVCGLKMFTAQAPAGMGLIEKDDEFKVFKALAELDYRGVLSIHCEKESLFDPSAPTHNGRRPPISEEQAVRDQIENAEKAGFKGNVHIAHISAKGSLDAVREAKARGMRITCAATPHHILLNESADTIFVRMNPPLRSEADRQAIWDALFDGTIEWVESDHAPHTVDDKKAGAVGIPGMEGMLLTIRRLREAGMSEKRLSELFCTNAFKTFGFEEYTSPVPEITDKMIAEAKAAYPFSGWN